MIDLEYLQNLYNEGRLNECYEATTTFLLFNNQNTAAILLKAKCEFEFAREQETEEECEAMYASAYNHFETVLSHEPGNEEALLYAAYIIIYIFKTNIQQGIAYCNQLKNSENNDRKLKAISYRREAHYLTDEPDKVLEDIDLLTELYKEYYSHDRSLLDSTLNSIYLHKAHVYLHLKKDVHNALESYKTGFQYSSEGREEDAFIVRLAFENGEYQFGTMLYSHLFHNGFRCSSDELIELYNLGQSLLENGHVSEELVYCILITIRTLGEEFFEDYAAEVFNISKTYIESHPEWHIPYHFAGTVLYEAENYQEACSYLEKAWELKGMALTVFRYADAYYRTFNTLPVINKLPEDHPTEYYNAGVYFSDFAEGISDHYTQIPLKELKRSFYEKSYNGFYEYFCNGKGRALYSDRHIFAMCCNNYGIALSDLQEYEKAIQVHEIGYSMSPFWEQLSSWSTALIELNRSEEAINVLKTATAYSEEYLDFHNYLKLKGDLLDQTFKLGRTEEAKALLGEIENEYTSFIEVNKNELTAEYLFDLDRSYITIQNIRYEFLKEVSLEEANKQWHEQLKKNPDDNSAWYMLMQNYYELKDYAQCIACADNYQKIKQNTVADSDNLYLHYKRGVSYLNLKQYEKALEDLKVTLKIHQTSYSVDETSQASMYIHLATVTHILKRWEDCKQYAWDGIACFNRNDWAIDKDSELLMIQYADACKETNEIDAARETIDNLLSVKPDSVEALKRKAEWKPKGFFSFFKK